MAAVCGARVIETSAARVTVTVVEPVTPAALAARVSMSVETLLAKPVVDASLVTARAGVPVLQRIEESTCVLPLMKVPVAVKSC